MESLKRKQKFDEKSSTSTHGACFIGNDQKSFRIGCLEEIEHNSVKMNENKTSGEI